MARRLWLALSIEVFTGCLTSILFCTAVALRRQLYQTRSKVIRPRLAVFYYFELFGATMR